MEFQSVIDWLSQIKGILKWTSFKFNFEYYDDYEQAYNIEKKYLIKVNININAGFTRPFILWKGE